MSILKRIFFFFVLPILAVLSYNPAVLGQAASVIAVAIIFFLILGILLWRRSSSALSFAIFLNGLNVIVRLMIVLSTSFSEDNVFNLSFTTFGLAGLILSFYLMLRLDKVDVKKYMTR